MRDVIALAEYYEQIDPDIADATIERISVAPAPLLSTPAIGSVVTDRAERTCPVRATPFLLIHEEVEDEVRILRVRHQRQNWAVEP